jgi:hypothetical protein
MIDLCQFEKTFVGKKAVCEAQNPTPDRLLLCDDLYKTNHQNQQNSFINELTLPK